VIARVDAGTIGVPVVAEELATKLPDNVCRPVARYPARIPGHVMDSSGRVMEAQIVRDRIEVTPVIIRAVMTGFSDNSPRQAQLRRKCVGGSGSLWASGGPSPWRGRD